jgi:GNAT superfamily N-acetyltransferase
MPSLELHPVETTRELRRFVDVPWQLHAASPGTRWVPPLRVTVRDALDERRNPFYANAARRCWIARRGGRPVGRIAAIENRAHNAFHGDRTGFFGFFEVADDGEAAAALLDAAGEWLAARGLAAMRGPVSPSTNHECGVLVAGYEHHPVLLTAWNPPYYDALLAACGMRGVKDLLGWHVPVGEPGFALPPRYAEQAEQARAIDRLTFRDVDLKHFAREVDVLWDVYNAAWEPNWGFVPMTRPEFEHLARELKQLVDTRFAFAAEVDGRPAGFALGLFDYNVLFKRIGTGRLLPTGLFTLLLGARRLHTGRIMALGVREEYRTRRIFALFAHELVRRAQAAGVTGAEASWILEDNHRMNRPLQSIGAVPYRRWRLYERPVAGGASTPPGAA